ncbi:hypothetical protein [Methylobacterium oryzihabitans]|uniref:Uncharacterized protein n=1 Tax=Methylobacterium oryzihabitans TaxID=2499852 RepID=A0A437NY60_9HYPH|nr:hypothetical protein [Methylobacterium oryzihabitans]RVU14963.1 hypothetical protein EOE48_21315 [Methylobacterium oryzihabitans]
MTDTAVPTQARTCDPPGEAVARGGEPILRDARSGRSRPDLASPARAALERSRNPHRESDRVRSPEAINRISCDGSAIDLAGPCLAARLLTGAAGAARAA